MKICLSTLMPYQVAEPLSERPEDPRGPWPKPPHEFDPATGIRSTEAAFATLQMAEEMGFDWVGVTEHHYLPRLSPAPTLLAAALSQRIRRARVAILGATLPILNPVRVAEEFAALDTLLEGRLVAGVLRGTPNEFMAYSTDPTESRGMYHEGIELMLRAWTDPHPFRWEGRYYHFDTVAVWPGPIQRPHPPLLISGKSRESGSFAARHRLLIGLSFDTVADARDEVAHYRSEAAAAGWEPSEEHVLYRGYCYVGDTDEEARELAATSLFGYRKAEEPVSRSPRAEQHAVGAQRESRRAATLERLAGWDGSFFCGNPDTVFEQIRYLHEEAGIGVVDLIFNDNRGYGLELPYEREVSSLRRFGAEVLPRVREL